MRGDDALPADDFLLDALQAAFELRRPDARQRALQALRRADDPGRQREIDRILKVNRNRRLVRDDEGPTAECVVHHHRRQRGDTIETLVARSKLAYHQQAAAQQIARIYESVTAPLWSRNAAWALGRVDSSNGAGSGIPERLASLHQRKFLPWARWMADPRSLFQVCGACGRTITLPARVGLCQCGARRLWRSPPHLGVVLSIVVFGSPLEATAIAYRMRRSRALRLLQLGLDKYADFV